MIKLKVEDYCHNCKDFEPITGTSTMYSNFSDVITETVVQCKNHEKCRLQYEYLKNQARKNDALSNKEPYRTNVINPATDW